MQLALKFLSKYMRKTGEFQDFDVGKQEAPVLS